MKSTFALPEDLPLISKELEQEKLCYEDLHNENVLIWKMDEDGDFVGFYGLEIYNQDALLRSVVIKKDKRSTGLGSKLVADALVKARENNVANLYLLTFTASSFFQKLGFKIIDRAAVPESISGTEEFAKFCPDTAICMTKRI